MSDLERLKDIERRYIDSATRPHPQKVNESDFRWLTERARENLKLREVLDSYKALSDMRRDGLLRP